MRYFDWPNRIPRHLKTVSRQHHVQFMIDELPRVFLPTEVSDDQESVQDTECPVCGNDESWPKSVVSPCASPWHRPVKA